MSIHALGDYDQFAFDLDGVLVDSEQVVKAALGRWAMKHRLSPAYVIEMSRARRDVDLVAEIAPGLSAEREAQRIAEYEVEAMNLLEPVPGAVEFFLSLPSSRRSIVTSSARLSAVERLQAVGITGSEVMITAEDVMQGKPDPAPYLKLLERRRIRAQRCLVFEDSEVGIAAAVGAGCECIGIGASARGHPEIIDWMKDFRSLSTVRMVKSPRVSSERSVGT